MFVLILSSQNLIKDRQRKVQLRSMHYHKQTLCAFVVLCISLALGQEKTDTEKLLALSHRNAQDIAMIMEDVKVLLYQQPPKQREPSDCSVATLSFKPENCKESSTESGLTTIFIKERKYDIGHLFTFHPLTVYCDQRTSHGGWIVLMRHVNRYEDFPNRLWHEYKAGFGDPNTSFWIGLENMHLLTKDATSMTLRIDLEDFEGNSRFAEYSYFRVSSENDGYRLFIEGYSGDAGDALRGHSGQKFSTIDKDNDIHTSISCAQRYHGAWWYKMCLTSCLTGEYIEGAHDKPHQGVYWKTWKGEKYSYKRAEMKIRQNI